jgi:hypothetical protein
MNNWLEILAGFIFSPRRGVRRVIQRKPWVLALLVLLFALASCGTAAALTIGGGFPGGARAYAIRLLAGGGLALAFAFVFSALLHLAADALRGAGSGIALFLSLLCCLLPWLFATPLMLALTSLGFRYSSFLALSAVLTVWSVLLGVTSVREIYRFGLGRAVAVLLIPLLLLAAAAYGTVLCFTRC